MAIRGCLELVKRFARPLCPGQVKGRGVPRPADRARRPSGGVPGVSSQERSGPASAGRPGNDPYDAGGTARASTGAPAGTGAAGRHAS